MGAPLVPQAQNMRCSIFALALAIVYASASPIADSVVPEDSHYAVDDDLSEAQQKINQMTAAGASDKDCRKLVTETRKDVQTNVDSCQKIIDAMPKGEHCVNLGQANVKAATEAKAKGEAEEAAKALTAAIAAAAKEKLDCECKTKADHEKAFAAHSASDAANQKAWNFACKVECVLDGKTTCTCSAAPMCKRAKLTAAVMEAVCVAKKSATPSPPPAPTVPKGPCPAGYKQVGSKTKSNDVHGACLGQSVGNSMAQCEAKCQANKKCTSFMYGKPAQSGAAAGLCELCDRDPNNSWGTDFVFCKRA